MNLSTLKTVVRYPREDLLWRAISKPFSMLRSLKWRIKDRLGPGAVASPGGVPDITYTYCPAVQVEACDVDRTLDQHRLIPGSGWAGVCYRDDAEGIWGIRYDHRLRFSEDELQAEAWLGEMLRPRHADRARDLWNLVSYPYMPVDWQRDIRSGFRWSERTWFEDIEYGHVLGADIRVPWEIGRMQHLPSLALSADSEDDRCDRIIRHIENELVDFSALNPVGWGVQWRSAMEVGLRAANVLVARDILDAKGLGLRPEVERVAARSAYEHAVFILNNLAWSPRRRNNHYLVEIVSVLVIAAYLEETEETNAWLQFAVSELLKEVEYQFNPEGSNFEGSTTYHLFSSEAVAVGVAFAEAVARREGHRLISSADFSRLPVTVRMRLNPEVVAERLSGDEWLEALRTRCDAFLDFVTGIVKPDGTVPLIGDNDSGRFFDMVSPRDDGPSRGGTGIGKQPFGRLKAQVSEVTSLLGVIGGQTAAEPEGHGSVESRILGAVAGRRASKDREGTTRSSAAAVGTEKDVQITWSIREFVPGRRVTVEVGCDGVRLDEDVSVRQFDHFGLVVLVGEHVYVTLRTSPKRQAFAPTGHRHNDALSSELMVCGRNVVLDPGSPAYTGSPGVRNLYRSSAAHWSPIHSPDSERDALKEGLFVNRWECRVVLDQVDSEGARATCKYPEGKASRTIEVSDHTIRFRDELEEGSGTMGCPFPQNHLFSPEYGRITGSASPGVAMEL